jgi:hypothetical protein
MSATSAPRYFAHVNVNDGSSGARGAPAGDGQRLSGPGSTASASGEPEVGAHSQRWFDSGAPTDADEGAPDVNDSEPLDGTGFGHDAKGGPQAPPDVSEWLRTDRVSATSSVSAEAQQGDGPAAASASASGVGQTTQTMTVAVVVGPNGAAAAGPFGVVVVGPHGVAAASQVGVAAVGPHGAASASNAANSTRAVVDDHAVPVESERE